MTLVLDASAVIAHLEASDVHHDAIEVILLNAVGESLAASPITIAEILVGPARAQLLDQAQHALETLGLSDVPLTAESPMRLATLRAQTGLKLPDCCVLEAASTERAPVVTFDNRLAAAARSLGLEVRGV